MSLNRYSKRRDTNEQPIVQALRAAGCEVFVQDTPCDLFVWRPRIKRWFALEVKTAKGKLTHDQRMVIRRIGEEAIRVVRTPIEALEAVGIGVE